MFLGARHPDLVRGSPVWGSDVQAAAGSEPLFKVCTELGPGDQPRSSGSPFQPGGSQNYLFFARLQGFSSECQRVPTASVLFPGTNFSSLLPLFL